MSADVTVVMPVKNGCLFIESAIRSVLCQTYRDFELWVVDNGSEDGTPEAVKAIADPRVKLFQIPPVGMTGAIQYAMDRASTPWIARMDADDLVFPARLEVQMNFLKRNPDIAFVGVAHCLLTPFGHIIEKVTNADSREVTTQSLCRGRFMTDASVIFNRQKALEAGGTDLKYKNKDIPLYFRMLKRNRGWEIPETLYVYRYRNSSVSKSGNGRQIDREIRKDYAAEFYQPPQGADAPYDYWRRIARYELLAGNPAGIDAAATLMEKESAGYSDAAYARKIRAQASSMKLRSRVGPLAFAYYRFRNRGEFRHRPDWEKLFAGYLLRMPGF